MDGWNERKRTEEKFFTFLCVKEKKRFTKIKVILLLKFNTFKTKNHLEFS